MIIVKVHTDHLAEIILLLNSFGLPTDDVESSDIEFYVIESEEQIVGCIGLEEFGNVGLLRSLAVNTKFQGKGVGIKLVTHLENVGADKALTHMYLLTETAEEFFSKHGYNKIRRELAPMALKTSSEFSHLCPDSAVLMMKKL